MKKFLESILDAGSQHELPDYLKNRVRPTNIICLLVIFVLSIPFVVISIIYFPKMAVFPAAAAIISAGIIAINRAGGIYYSRLALPLLLLTLSSLYNAYFSTSIADSVTSVSLIELSFTLIAFVIFDFREKGFLAISTLFSLFILIIFPFSWSYFDIGYDGSVLREGPLAVLTTMLALIFQLGCITGLSFINRQSENRSNRFLEEMNKKNLEIEQSRKVLETNIEQLEKARTEENNRQWTNEGLSKISNILRESTGTQTIYDKIISCLVNYLKANQGGFYIVRHQDNQETIIQLVACYAYSRKKYIEQEYRIGEGLIGQVYLEKDYIFMTDVPADYVRITSGLGQATPRCILVMPLKVNGEIQGVLELASFQVFAPYQIECIEKLGEIIASYILSNKNNEQTQKLLKESTQQAEALRAQEEELRQNLEELAATQEEVIRKENEYVKEIQRLTDALNSYQALKQHMIPTQA